MKTTKLQLNRQDRVFFFLFLAALAVNLYRVPFGFPSTDESFFITLIQRLAKGELPLRQIWNPVQFGAIGGSFLYHFFVKVTGSTDGIFVFFRLIYTVMMAMAALAVYICTRKKSIWAVFPPLIYMLYSLLQLMVFHYDTIGLFGMTMMGCLLCFGKKYCFLRAMAAGICYAFSVLCTPHLAVLYFLGTLFLLVSLIRGSRNHQYAQSCWLPFTLGCVVSAMMILLYIFSRISFSEFVTWFPNLLASDARNASAGPVFLINTLALFKMIWLHNSVTAVLVPILAILVVLPEKWIEKTGKEKIHCLMLVIAEILLITYRRVPYNYGMIVFSALGIYACRFEKDKALRNFFFCGLAYVFMINISSNTILSASSHASALAMPAALLMFTDGLKGRKEEKVLFSLLLVSMLGMEVMDRLTVTWQDGSPLEMHETISEGPAAGIKTTSLRGSRYQEDFEELSVLLKDTEGNVLFFADHSWMYLLLDENRHDAVHSTWFELYSPETRERLALYYEEVEERRPDYVFMPVRVADLLEEAERLVEPYGIVLEKSNRWYSGGKEQK